jgi:hypothetical protein
MLAAVPKLSHAATLNVQHVDSMPGGGSPVNEKNPLTFRVNGFCEEPPGGLEPSTYALRMRRSTN